MPATNAHGAGLNPLPKTLRRTPATAQVPAPALRRDRKRPAGRRAGVRVHPRAPALAGGVLL
ncbi:hypothetical protein I7I48_06117 [Histoplasma ohiense]|nr:hypothetical protein I7I48_06117 [Histoplasma ohiense (nom. inval.)]